MRAPVDFDENLIQAEHVREAVRRFLLDPHPPRPARSAILIHDGRRLPAKHIVRLAFEVATGFLPKPEQLTGGRASVRVLEALGFEAVFDRTSVTGGARNAIKSARLEALRSWLAEHFGDVIMELRLESVTIPNLRDRSIFDPTARSILGAIESVRGYTVEGKMGRKLSFDMFLPKVGILIEFDERQHFTPARAASLQAYPASLRLGFDCNRWIRLCEEIRAGDNDPKYRDEQRAFYDTLRDLAPARLGFPPLVRIFEEDVRWERPEERESPAAKAFLAHLKRLATRSA